MDLPCPSGAFGLSSPLTVPGGPNSLYYKDFDSPAMKSGRSLPTQLNCWDHGAVGRPLGPPHFCSIFYACWRARSPIPIPPLYWLQERGRTSGIGAKLLQTHPKHQAGFDGLLINPFYGCSFVLPCVVYGWCVVLLWRVLSSQICHCRISVCYQLDPATHHLF